MSDGTETWSDLWSYVTSRLGEGEAARRIIEQASGKSGASWLVIVDNQAPIGAGERVEAMVERCLAGEPLQYVLGKWGFRQLELYVDQRVLIPRPETEQVVEAALRLFKPYEAPLVVDLGTGSGAIALAIAQELPNCRVIATDESADALEVARRNRDSLSPSIAGRVTLVEGSWFDALDPALAGAIDLVISNPPYVADEAEIDDLVRKWEPHGALFSGRDGLDDIEAIVTAAPRWLKAKAKLVFELSPEQSTPARELLRANNFTAIEVGRDFVGRDRWIVAARGPSF